ncbi:MAG: anaerobic sulfatase maturase, partial [bacterium]
LEVYHFLKEIGSGFMQFIPIVERIAKVTPANRLNLMLPNYHEESKVSAWSVEPMQFGNFLITLILL